MPCSGPITCTIPCRGSFTPKIVIPNSLQLFSNASICFFDKGSLIPNALSEVGTPWSTVAKVNSGYLTFLLLILKLSKAWGEVTS